MGILFLGQNYDMPLDERNLEKLLATQTHILEELETLRYGDLNAGPLSARAADAVVSAIGSWKFLIIQSVLLSIWILINVIAISMKWDPYPFILLNLMLSFQAAYASPLILMASNRSAEKDRRRAIDAYRSIAQIEKMLDTLVSSMETETDEDEDAQADH